jgi:CheY-like chemotaxis protein
LDPRPHIVVVEDEAVQRQLLATGVTQFGRALLALNIDIICANSPQAKGRIERAFGKRRPSAFGPSLS